MMSMYYKRLIEALDIKTFEPDPEPLKNHFEIFGIVSDRYFQKSVAYVHRLHQSCPKEYDKPTIRPMLNVEWNTFLTKLKRKRGKGSILWLIQKNVTVFLNGDYIGDDSDLLQYISVKYRLHIAKDFVKVGKDALCEYLQNESDLGRNFIYMTVAINNKVIGSMLFLIYSDLVPETSEQFISRCCRDERGYSGKPIHRIAKSGWIQCGGWKWKRARQSCENYVISHDQRGTLSMCNHGKHVDNSTQFMITLSPSTWMDYLHVAFGKLIQGDEILTMIENVPTHYEKPLKQITIVKTGEFTIYPEPDLKETAMLKEFLRRETCSAAPSSGENKLRLKLYDVQSQTLQKKLDAGFYSAKSDLKSNLPFEHIPNYTKYMAGIKLVEEQEALEIH